MRGLFVEVKTSCKHCGHVVPFNAFVNRVICGSCNEWVEVPTERWQFSLRAALRHGLKLAEGFEVTDLDGFAFRLGPATPRCDACQAEIALPVPPEAERQGWVACTGCQRRFPVRPPSADLGALAPGVVQLIGENVDQIAGRAGTLAAPAGHSAVQLPCPGCGAALPLDGKSRNITCSYCRQSAYLPDDVWQRLHPVEAVTSWYMCYSGAA